MLKQLEVSSERVEDQNDVLSKILHRNCVFCDKMVRISEDNLKSCINLSKKRFYCPFCIRNNFHCRSSKNVLTFSYRAVIGYYYFKHYKKGAVKKLWLNQLTSFIEMHQTIGLRNPILSYDPDTYLWFADFNKVGKESFRAPFKEVLISAKWILHSFEIDKLLGKFTFDDMWEKYEKAFDVFYKQRKRPLDRKMLIPTLRKNVHGSEEFFTDTRNFMPYMLELKT